ncbi:unannotated protein [freshwater metagenome]|uniref:Unannotated protein n=1 Tax=freshwater metagenome TaxID=449393 RepID=A0A6J7DVE7_9ZZZZ
MQQATPRGAIPLFAGPEANHRFELLLSGIILILRKTVVQNENGYNLCGDL